MNSDSFMYTIALVLVLWWYCDVIAYEVWVVSDYFKKMKKVKCTTHTWATFVLQKIQATEI